ncbi:MAG: ABC transporter permease [Trueperaceae bacterium]
MTASRAESRGDFVVPTAVLAWVGVSLLLIVLSFIQVELQDRRFMAEMATLAPTFWLPTLGFSELTLLHVGAVNTDVPLFYAALLFAIIEVALAYAYRSSEYTIVRPLVRAATIFLAFWSLFGSLTIWDAILGAVFPLSTRLLYPRATVIGLAAEHLELIIVSSIITVSVGLALGILVTRLQFREFLPLVSNFVSAGQTVPTLAIVAIMVPILGFGFWPAIIALILYGMLPVVRNTVAGLEAVDPSMIDSARGMGMTAPQILWQIELPNASSIILAGIRTSVVINVGTAALGAFVGSGGLGVPIAGGISTANYSYVLEGALPAAMLAILLDYILGRVEFVLTPRGLQIAS